MALSGQNSRYGQGCPTSGSPRGKSVSSPFQFLGSLACGPSSFLKASDADLSPSPHSHLWFCLQSPPQPPVPSPTVFFVRICISIGKGGACRPRQRREGHGWTRMPEDGGGAGEAGTRLVEGAPEGGRCFLGEGYVGVRGGRR